jgi:hypothetical protein
VDKAANKREESGENPYLFWRHFLQYLMVQVLFFLTCLHDAAKSVVFWRHCEAKQKRVKSTQLGKLETEQGGREGDGRIRTPGGRSCRSPGRRSGPRPLGPRGPGCASSCPPAVQSAPAPRPASPGRSSPSPPPSQAAAAELGEGGRPSPPRLSDSKRNGERNSALV